MSKKKKRRDAMWRRQAPKIGAKEWLKALGIAAAMALVAFAATYVTKPPAEVELPVVIDRVMTSNPSACYPVDGAYCDWLALKNISAETVDLEGWRLSNTGDLREAFVFGSCLLEPGASTIVYCRKAPEGYTGSAVFTGFSLSADGEYLMLADPQKRSTSLIVPALPKTNVYLRDGAGNYKDASFAEAMGEDAALRASLSPDFDPDGIMIGEIMPVNRSTLTDADGDFSDWIELYNATGAAVDLSNWSLSDNDAVRDKWRFPEGAVIGAGEYRIVFASGKDSKDASGEWHTNFKLAAEGETVRLYDASGNVVSWAAYPETDEDVSLSRCGDGSLTDALDPTPGRENTEESALAASMTPTDNDMGLYINELMAFGDGDDWIELHNATQSAIDLTGLWLSDDPGKPRKWAFPEGAKIAADGYVLIGLQGSEDRRAEKAGDSESDDGEDARRTDYAADFSLAVGESACLSDAGGNVIDSVQIAEMRRNVSLGRARGYDSYRVFGEPTPGKPNTTTSYEKAAKAIEFSTPPGLVRAKAIALELASDADVPVYYTTDGTLPTKKSQKYTAPIPLKENTVIRAIAWREDVLPTDPVTATFIFADHTVRLVCVTGKRSELNGSGGTLNTGAKKDGYDVHIEVYEPDGTKLVGQDCFFILSGRQSRTDYPQKSFRLAARREYGDTRFRAALFTNRPYTEYKSLVIRSGGQDSDQTKMRDSILTSLAADTGVMYQETEACVVYINGSYWGVYNMRERVDEHSLCQFHGWSDPDSVVIGEGNGSGMKEYGELKHWITQHDLSKDENIEKLREMMDIENYLDYVALQMYTANQDLNNVRFYCNRAEDARLRWVLFDLDLSYQIDRNSPNDWLHSDEAGTVTQQDTLFFRKLMDNKAMRDYFLTRMGGLLATTFSAENVTGKIEERVKIMQPEMAANCKRWGWKTGTWEKYVKRMTDYAEARPKKLIGYLKSAFRLSDEQAEKYFGEALRKNQ